MQLSFRGWILIILFVAATIPVSLLGWWVQKSSLDQERETVKERHLLIAKNITLALERFVNDVQNTFSYITRDNRPQALSLAEINLMRSVDLDYYAISNKDGQVIHTLISEKEPLANLPDTVVPFLEQAVDNGTTVFTPLLSNDEKLGHFYLIRRIETDQFAVAALDPSYVRKIQSSIVFGRLGHSAIVDQVGTIIGHPNPNWVKEMKNIAKVKPVKFMMSGKSGVTDFYSPAIKKDMVTGYTVVPNAGWGVMVPQPFEELVERANSVRLPALYIGLGGLALTILLGLWLSGRITKPLRVVTDAARKMRTGHLDTRVTPMIKSRTREFQELGSAFDTMAQEIQNDRVALISRIEKSESDDDEGHSHLIPQISTAEELVQDAILVVDDSARRRLWLTGYLVKSGYAAISAESYEQAIDLILTAKPRLVLVNFILSDRSGFQVLREVKKTPGYEQTPVVLMFNKNQMANQFWARRQGATGFLLKPISEKALIETIQLYALKSHEPVG